MAVFMPDVGAVRVPHYRARWRRGPRPYPPSEAPDTPLSGSAAVRPLHRR
jgi:hypothetical protein